MEFRSAVQARTQSEELSRPFIQRAPNSGSISSTLRTPIPTARVKRLWDEPCATSLAREDVVVATKVFHPMRPGPNGSGLSRKAIFHEIDASLRRLQMDYVDLYQIHR